MIFYLKGEVILIILINYLFSLNIVEFQIKKCMSTFVLMTKCFVFNYLQECNNKLILLKDLMYFY